MREPVPTDSPAPQGHYVSCVTAGGFLHISGQGPRRHGRLVHVGRVGDTVTTDQARAAAQLCAHNLLAQAATALSGDLGRIEQVVTLSGFVNSTPEFNDHTGVLDAASDVIVTALGDRGRHTRTAVGVASLPGGMAVEIGAILALTH